LALQIAGAAAVLRDRISSRAWPNERARLEAAIARARQGVSEGAADAAWMRGWTQTIDQTLGTALDFLEDTRSVSVRSEVADV